MCRVHPPDNLATRSVANPQRSAAVRTPTFLYRAHARARETVIRPDGTHPLETRIDVRPGAGGKGPPRTPGTFSRAHARAREGSAESTTPLGETMAKGPGRAAASQM
jgi:hypothetical protein